MSAPTQISLPPIGGEPTPPAPDGGNGNGRRRKASWRSDATERGLISARDMDRRSVRYGFRACMVLVLGTLVLIAGGPLLWLFKFAVSTSQDILARPLGWWPSGIQWANLYDAWTRIEIGKYLVNTLWVAGGSWILTLVICTTGGFALSVLRPKYGPILTAAVLATLFIPGVISLVSLYLTILDLPILGINLLNSFWAVWLPSASSAFSVLIVKRFFDNLPRDLFDAAKVDGAGPFRLFAYIVLPMSKPILGVISLFTIINAWEAFLWPLLVLPDPDKQPLSVALPRLEENAELSLLMAGMFISVIIPLIVFMIFQRQFLKGAGQLGMIKG